MVEADLPGMIEEKNRLLEGEIRANGAGGAAGQGLPVSIAPRWVPTDSGI